MRSNQSSNFRQGFYYNNENQQSKDFKYQNTQQKSEAYYFIRDPTTGRVIRVKINNYYNGPKQNYDHTQHPGYNPNFDYTVHRSYSKKIDMHYANYDNEDEINVKPKHIFTIILTTIALFMFIRAIHKNTPEGPLIYKNTIYYPKNKDPIMADMIKNQGYIPPPDLFKTNYK